MCNPSTNGSEMAKTAMSLAENMPFVDYFIGMIALLCAENNLQTEAWCNRMESVHSKDFQGANFLILRILKAILGIPGESLDSCRGARPQSK